MSRWVYRFEDADPEAVALLGGKGAGLARMTRAGLPVPPGFIITTRACAEYVATGKVPAGVTEEVRTQVAALEHETERSFGGGPLPLLVSVRSGAPVSMPGMMETILNLGIGRDAAVALAEATGDLEFVLDVTRRLQKGFSEIVLGGDPDVIDKAVADFALPADGTPFGETFDRYWARCRQALEEDVGAAAPDDPWEQLQAAVMAVLRSWTSRRALTYREHQKISHDMGTAVVVQSMVFGNLGSPSGTGVAFTRNPVTGQRALYGEFLEHGQGEDLVAGVADPETIAEAAERNPEVFDELARICETLELAYGDVLDIEYTVERGKLYLLQVRSAKRTPEAAIRIAADMLREGRVEPSAAVAGVSADHLRLGRAAELRSCGPREGASRGCGSRRWHRGLTRAGHGQARPRLRPGRRAGQGGQGAHPGPPHDQPAGPARAHRRRRHRHGSRRRNESCRRRSRANSRSRASSAARALSIDEERRTLTAGERVLQEGDAVSIDGDAGELLVGSVRVTRVAASGADLSLLMDRADAASGCTVLAQRHDTGTGEDGARARRHRRRDQRPLRHEPRSRDARRGCRRGERGDLGRRAGAAGGDGRDPGRPNSDGRDRYGDVPATRRRGRGP